MKVKISFLNAAGIWTEEDQLILETAQQQLENTAPMREAIQIKAAEFWLKLGEADQALRELEHLPHNTWNHSKAMKIRIAAIGMLRERGELNVQK